MTVSELIETLYPKVSLTKKLIFSCQFKTEPLAFPVPQTRLPKRPSPFGIPFAQVPVHDFLSLTLELPLRFGIIMEQVIFSKK